MSVHHRDSTDLDFVVRIPSKRDVGPPTVAVLKKNRIAVLDWAIVFHEAEISDLLIMKM
nr:hypothetical protein [uncultured Ruegeria sp.]